MAVVALTAALTFTPVMGERWIPTEYVDAIRKEAHYRNPSGSDVATPPPITGVEQWRPLVAAYFPPNHVDRMLRIMQCESGGNPNAWNRKTNDRGLFQIHQAIWQKAWPGDHFNPYVNVAVAYQIWLEQGYQAWVCRG